MRRQRSPRFFPVSLLIGVGITPTNPCHSSWTVLAKLPWTLSPSGTRPTPAW